MIIRFHSLICNNELGRVTRPIRGQITSIINLIFTIPNTGPLDSWFMDKELATSSNHMMIVFDLANLNEIIESMGTSQEVMRWLIRAMSEKEKTESQGAQQE